MPNDNRALVMRWVEEVWNQQRPETIDEVMTDDSICYMDPGPLVGGKDFHDLQYAPLVRAFPDIHVTVDSIIDNGNEVAFRWTAKGTHTGDGLPIPPTHKAVVMSGISWICVRGGKFREGWQSSNIADVIRSLAEPAPVG